METSGRTKTWEELDRPEVWDTFRHLLAEKLSELGDYPNEATRQFRIEARNTYVGTRLDVLRNIWQEVRPRSGTEANATKQENNNPDKDLFGQMPGSLMMTAGRCFDCCTSSPATPPGNGTAPSATTIRQPSSSKYTTLKIAR